MVRLSKEPMQHQRGDKGTCRRCFAGFSKQTKTGFRVWHLGSGVSGSWLKGSGSGFAQGFSVFWGKYFLGG
jgi:hypothetical protein